VNKATKYRWLKALRSGKYQRGRDKLKGHGRYCCLGVLGEVTGIPYSPDDHFLNHGMASHIGLTETDQELLANLNDGCVKACSHGPQEFPKGYKEGKGINFKDLANWIQRHL
jgi:hypothetical protein